MCQDHDEGSGVEVVVGDHLVGPAHPELVDIREAVGGDEGGPGVGHHGVKAEQRGMLHQLLCDMDRAEHEETRAGRDHLIEDLGVLVAECDGALRPHQRLPVPGHQAEEVGGEVPGDQRRRVVEDGLGALVGTGDDGDDHSEPVIVGQLAGGVDDRVGHHGSMYTWIVPPQARPTAKASSSAIP